MCQVHLFRFMFPDISQHASFYIQLCAFYLDVRDACTFEDVMIDGKNVFSSEK